MLSPKVGTLISRKREQVKADMGVSWRETLKHPASEIMLRAVDVRLQ